MMQGSIHSLLGIIAGSVSQRTVSRALQLVAHQLWKDRIQFHIFHHTLGIKGILIKKKKLVKNMDAHTY